MRSVRRLVIISDLHIGGERLPMMGHPEKLCQFLSQVADYSADKDEKIELVINGDFVDFLAIEPYQAWTPTEDETISKLQRVFQQFSAVFDALAKCVAKIHNLTILLGNHDIESAFPKVREALLARLGADSHRCLFIANNEAYRRGDVLIEHGNRYDAWNAVNYDDLRRTISQMSRLEPLSDFDVAPGSQMVEKFVNQLKVEYPFIDLLKPETKILPLVLSALEPSLKRDVKRLFGVFSLWSEQWRRTRNWLPSVGKESEKLIASTNIKSGLPQSLVDAFRDELSGADDTERRISVRQRWQVVVEKIRPESIAQKIHKNEPIGSKQLKRVQLSLARALEGDRTFDDDSPEGPYADAARRMLFVNGTDGRRPKVVVMGHTHLIRQIDFKEGRYYLNTGTWVDLIKVPPEIVDETTGTAKLDEWLRHLILDTKTLRIADPAYADILLDEAGQIRQSDNKPMLRRLTEAPFAS